MIYFTDENDPSKTYVSLYSTAFILNFEVVGGESFGIPPVIDFVLYPYIVQLLCSPVFDNVRDTPDILSSDLHMFIDLNQVLIRVDNNLLFIMNPELPKYFSKYFYHLTEPCHTVDKYRKHKLFLETHYNSGRLIHGPSCFAPLKGAENLTTGICASFMHTVVYEGIGHLARDDYRPRKPDIKFFDDLAVSNLWFFDFCILLNALAYGPCRHVLFSY